MTALLVVASATGCSPALLPNAEYAPRRDPVARIPLRVDVDVRWPDVTQLRVTAGSMRLAMQPHYAPKLLGPLATDAKTIQMSARAALRADLRQNGPFAVDTNAPQAILHVDITSGRLHRALNLPSCALTGLLLGVPALAGLPYRRTEIELAAVATLVDGAGNVLAEVEAREMDSFHTGLWYNQRIALGSVMAKLAASIRRQLAGEREDLLARVEGRKPPLRVAGPAAPAPAVAAPTALEPAQPFVQAAPQRRAYAVVIGIERYREQLPPATGARRDAERFAALLRESFGVPADQIKVALDDHATRADLEKHLRWLHGNAGPNSRIYFFYSGHGAPDPTKGTAFLLPYDGDPAYVDQTAMPLAEVLARLGATRAKEVFAFVDACFSGAGGRSVLPAGARPLVQVKETRAGPRVALLSASSGVEISGPTADGRGGLFTHLLLQALGSGRADSDGDGRITMAELHAWLKPRVAREAQKANRAQTPSLQLGRGAGAPRDLVVTWGVAAR